MKSVYAFPRLPRQPCTILSKGGGNLYYAEHSLGKNQIGEEIKMTVPTGN
jgi:hypothetical protein